MIVPPIRQKLLPTGTEVGRKTAHHELRNLLKMTEFFSCNDNTGRYIFNIVFFSLIGALAILLIFLGGYLLYKRHKKAKKRRQRLLGRSRTNTTNTTSTILSGNGVGSQLASNFILGRPPATDVVLGVYGDEISKNARTAFYEEKGWRGFAY